MNERESWRVGRGGEEEAEDEETVKWSENGEEMEKAEKGRGEGRHESGANRGI